MSKTALRKELAGFSREQLVELVLDLYDARKEVKEYFNFFLNPDSAKLFEKYRKMIDKEFSRSKWGYCKARISVIRKLLKEFESFSPDGKYRHAMYAQVIYFALYADNYLHLPDALANGIRKITAEYLKYAANESQLDDALNNIENITRPETPGTNQLKRSIKDTCRDILQEMGI